MAEPARSITPDTKQAQQDQLIVQAINRCFTEAENARRDRMKQNADNRLLFMGRQDWSHKIEGQSRTFLPKVACAAEQMSAFIKKGLVQFGDWFSVELSPVLEESALKIEGHQVRGILNHFLDKLLGPQDQYACFSVTISDAVKMGLLESLIVLKCHGGMHTKRIFAIEPGRASIGPDGRLGAATPDKLSSKEQHYWTPAIDLVATDDYYPDPTGRGLYEIHEVYRDYHQVLDDAEDGLYDLEAVKSLEGQGTDDHSRRDQKRSEAERGQNEPSQSTYRKPLRLREFWGTILDENGKRLHRNCVATLANDRVLIRRPEPNPFWHQESPFVVAPLVRVPHSVWHKALYDHASSLNVDLNEVFSLMVDGGLAAVWGVRQIRMDALEDPNQVVDGIPQGTTLAVNATLPSGQKVMEECTTGKVPQEAAMMYQALSNEFTAAALTTELRTGTLPPRTVKATEVVEQSQSQNITLEGIIGDVERELIERALRKTWMNILQFMDDMDPSEVLASGNPRAAAILLRLKPPQRYVLFAKNCTFKVSGLSATLARARDFQRVMAALQVFGGNPMLAQSFLKRFLPEKFIDFAFKCLNINPDDFARDKTQQAEFEKEMQDTLRMSQAMGGGGKNMQGTPAALPNEAEGSIQGEINQMGNPLSGMTQR